MARVSGKNYMGEDTSMDESLSNDDSQSRSPLALIGLIVVAALAVGGIATVVACCCCKGTKKPDPTPAAASEASKTGKVPSSSTPNSSNKPASKNTPTTPIVPAPVPKEECKEGELCTSARVELMKKKLGEATDDLDKELVKFGFLVSALKLFKMAPKDAPNDGTVLRGIWEVSHSVAKDTAVKDETLKTVKKEGVLEMFKEKAVKEMFKEKPSPMDAYLKGIKLPADNAKTETILKQLDFIAKRIWPVAQRVAIGKATAKDNGISDLIVNTNKDYAKASNQIQADGKTKEFDDGTSGSAKKEEKGLSPEDVEALAKNVEMVFNEFLILDYYEFSAVKRAEPKFSTGLRLQLLDKETSEDKTPLEQFIAKGSFHVSALKHFKFPAPLREIWETTFFNAKAAFGANKELKAKAEAVKTEDELLEVINNFINAQAVKPVSFKEAAFQKKLPSNADMLAVLEKEPELAQNLEKIWKTMQPIGNFVAAAKATALAWIDKDAPAPCSLSDCKATAKTILDGIKNLNNAFSQVEAPAGTAFPHFRGEDSIEDPSFLFVSNIADKLNKLNPDATKEMLELTKGYVKQVSDEFTNFVEYQAEKTGA